VAPANTVGRHALLLINPHTSFFFRSELQMVSDEGLNAYGAVTWGQFFVYQGFNERTGWMHTSSGVDAIDEYLETVTRKGDRYYYKYGGGERPLVAAEITVPTRPLKESLQRNSRFTAPSWADRPRVGGKWVSVRLMQEPLKSLTQSYTRTKTKDYKSFRQTMELHTNSSNTPSSPMRWRHRLLPWQFYSQARYPLRLDQAGDGSDPGRNGTGCFPLTRRRTC